LFIEVITIGIYLIAAYTYVEVLHLPIYLVWTAELVYFLILGILSFLYLRSKLWNKAG
jgi:hypothetical protein